jgi:hypothetical protein
MDEGLSAGPGVLGHFSDPAYGQGLAFPSAYMLQDNESLDRWQVLQPQLRECGDRSEFPELRPGDNRSSLQLPHRLYSRWREIPPLLWAWSGAAQKTWRKTMPGV